MLENTFRPLQVRPRDRLRLVGSIALALTLLAAGCTAPSNAAAPTANSPTQAAPAQPASTAAGQTAGQTMKVDLKNTAFAPQALTVAVGTTVEWRNSDSLAHTVTADNGAFDSGNMAQGATFQFTFTQAGTFPYYCKYHGGPGGQGMAGQVIVK